MTKLELFVLGVFVAIVLYAMFNQEPQQPQEKIGGNACYEVACKAR